MNGLNLKSIAGACMISFIGMTSAPAARADIVNACEPYEKRIDSLVSKYWQQAKQSQAGDADATFTELEGLLFNELGEHHPCFELSLERYMYSAFNNYDPGLIQESGPGFLITRSDGRMRPTRSLLPWLMIEKRKITFLTDSKRAELGPAWLEKVPGTDEYTTIGAYDCADTRIFLDAHLHPFDLVTTLYHEMDHLVRDKTMTQIPNTLLNKGSPQDPSEASVSWDLFNLADEASAIASSTVPFMGLHSLVNISHSGTILAHRHQEFQVKNDFTLFSKDGPVAQFRKLNMDVGPEKAAARLFGQSYDFEWPAARHVNDEIDARHKEWNLRNQFFATVWQAYFPGKTVVLGTSKDYDSFFENADHFRDFPGVLTWDANTHSDFLDKLMSSDGPTSLLEEPSPVCKRYMDSLALGDVSGYLGVRFSKQGAIRESIRPCVNFRRSL